MSENFPILSRAIDGFIIDKRGQGRSEDTIHDYTNTLRRFYNFIGAETPVNNITSRDITDFFT